MERLTYYDEVSECYKIKPDAPQGQLIQRLGRYENKDDMKLEVLRDKYLRMIEDISRDIENPELAKFKEYLITRQNAYEDIIKELEVLLS